MKIAHSADTLIRVAGWLEQVHSPMPSLQMPSAQMPSAQVILGCLLGTAIGDALGLPYENLSPARGRRLWGEPEHYRLWFGRGMTSDDTDHTCMVAEAWWAAQGDGVNLEHFVAILEQSLKRWLLTFPAGIGKATLYAGIRSWLKRTPSGVMSAGNGAAMRSSILGVLAEDDATLTHAVTLSSQLTHRDARAVRAALLVARAARWGLHNDPDFVAFWQACQHHIERDDELLMWGKKVGSSLLQPSLEFAREHFPKGVSGYAYHTVPMALHLCFSRDPRDIVLTLQDAVRCGGDSDTLAAITGGIAGAWLGARLGAREDVREVLEPQLRGLWLYPRGLAYLDALAQALASADDSMPVVSMPVVPTWQTVARGTCFNALVMAHVLRRMLPPY